MTSRILPRMARVLVRSCRAGAAGLFDLVYPFSCAACGEAIARGCGWPLCRACGDALPVLLRIPCPGCGAAPVPSPTTFCGACGRRYSRHGMAVALRYEGSARDLILSFKYRANLAAGSLLASLLAAAPGLAELPRPDVVVPVPLHRRRLRARGFNQAALLARGAARLFAAEFAPRLLCRPRPTAPLSGLTPQARRREVRGAFAVRRPERIRSRTVLLVDDVLTTGVTAEECCRTLKAAGSGRVCIAAAARKLQGRALH